MLELKKECAKCTYADNCICEEISQKAQKQDWKTMKDAYKAGQKDGALSMLRDVEKRLVQLNENIQFLKRLFE